MVNLYFSYMARTAPIDAKGWSFHMQIKLAFMSRNRGEFKKLMYDLTGRKSTTKQKQIIEEILTDWKKEIKCFNISIVTILVAMEIALVAWAICNFVILTPVESELNYWVGNVNAYLLLMVIYLSFRLIALILLMMGYDQVMMSAHEHLRSQYILPNSGTLALHILVLIIVFLCLVTSTVCIELGREYLADASTKESSNETI